MKRLFAILFLAVMLLGSALPAAADVIFIPHDSLFYEAHQDECTHWGRSYYANGAKGYVTTYNRPDGEQLDHIENANRLFILYTYQSGDTAWGMVTYLNSEHTETETWVRMEDLYLIYDGISFREEHESEIKAEYGTVAGSQDRVVYSYDYPGAANPTRYTYPPEEPFDYSETYTDPRGKRWGYVGYYKGIRKSWICLDALGVVQQPFGGDPALQAIGPNEEGEAPSVLIPGKTPPRFFLDPLVLTAIILVLLALLAALLLLKFCYRNKKKSDAPTDT